MQDAVLVDVTNERAGRATAHQDPDEIAAMMAKAKAFTEPGPEHEALERMIGSWDFVTMMTMGVEPTVMTSGTVACEWKIDGRWLESSVEGAMSSGMGGGTFRGVQWLGYDRFKKSYVLTQITNMDTAMVRAEGDMAPSGEALVLYGEMDEYLTGEHDKMVQWIWRFDGADRFVVEIHDLAIGLENTKVLESTYTRRR